MALSVLARLMRQGAFEKFESGLESTRTSARPLAKRGFTRGTLGSTSSPGIKSRNPDAAEEEDRAMLNSPIMNAFLGGGA